MMRWLIYIVVGLVAIVGIVSLIGLALPKGHKASRTAVYPASPAVVFAAISDFARYPEWRTDLKKVELIPDDGRGVGFREYGKNGTITYRVEASEPGARLVVRIADTSLAFGGSWTYQLRPAGTGTELTITEDGEVYNPIFRFMSKFVFSPTATIEAYQKNLGSEVFSTDRR